MQQQEQQNPEKVVSGIRTVLICQKGDIEIPNASLVYGTQSCILKYNNTSIHISYENVISFGKNQLDLLVFVKSEDEDEEEEKDFGLFDLINSKLKDQAQLSFNMIGPYHIKFDFTDQGKQVLHSVFEGVSRLATEFDQHNGKEGQEGEGTEEEEFDLDQMITADDIDQHGNIIQK